MRGGSGTRGLVAGRRFVRIGFYLKTDSRMTTADTKDYKTYMCLICGFIYEQAAGLPDEGIAPGTRWEDVPPNWTCPECGARKEDFEMVEI